MMLLARFPLRVRILGLLGAALVVAGLASAMPWPLLALAVLAVVALGLLALPRAAVLPVVVLLAPLRFFVTVPSIGVDVGLTGVALIGLAVLILIRQLSVGRPALDTGDWIVVGWWVWLMVSVAWSINRALTLRGMLDWTGVFAAILITTWYLSHESNVGRGYSRMLTALLGLVSIWCVVGFVQVAVGRDAVLAFLGSPAAAVLFPPRLLESRMVTQDFNWLSGTGGVQPFGPFINATEFGLFTAIGAGVATALLAGRARLVPRWVAAGTLVLSLAANAAALKGTGWISAIVALLVAAVALGGSIRRILVSTALVVVVATGVVLAFRAPLQERVRQLVVREQAAGTVLTALSRVSIWEYYLPAVLLQPITGTGLYTSVEHGPVRWMAVKYSETSVAARLPTENGYLSMAIEAGIPGLAALLLVVGGAAVVGLRTARRDLGHPVSQAAGAAAAGIAAIMVGNLTTDGFAQHTNGLILGVLVGTVIAARRRMAHRLPQRDTA